MKQFAHLLLCLVLLCDFFNDDGPKITVEIVSRLTKMVVYRNRIGSVHIVMVLIHTLVCALGFHLANILLLIAFQAETQVDGIF